MIQFDLLCVVLILFISKIRLNKMPKKKFVEKNIAKGHFEESLVLKNNMNPSLGLLGIVVTTVIDDCSVSI